jgi:broad specificity phosphatase PhoE
MATTILLIRHAAHDDVGRVLCGRMPGIALGVTGRRQAEALGVKLQPVVDWVYASPLQRTQETAACLGSDVRTSEAATEIDFGAWAGRSFEQLDSDPHWRAWNVERSRTRAPGGETMADVQDRVMAELGRLAVRHEGARVAVVSHGDVIKAALMAVLGLSLDAWLRFDIDPASVSRLQFGTDRQKVLSMNETLDS